MSDALLPCPFCGGEAKMRSSSTGFYWAVCINSPCRAETIPQVQAPAAIAAWNRRATPAEVNALRAEVERARNYLIRNVLLPLWPNIEPLPDLIGVCTQADNISAEIIALRARVERMEAALKPFAGLAAHYPSTRIYGNRPASGPILQVTTQKVHDGEITVEHLYAARAALEDCS